MSEFTLTNVIALAEQVRRAGNARLAKDERTSARTMLAGLAKAGLLPKAQVKAAESVLMKMGTADLADAIELAPSTTQVQVPTPAPAKAKPAPKSRKGTGVGGAEHTALRAEAKVYAAKQYKAGNKISYRDACIACGTLPAAEMAEVGTHGLTEALAAYAAAQA